MVCTPPRSVIHSAGWIARSVNAAMGSRVGGHGVGGVVWRRSVRRVWGIVGRGMGAGWGVYRVLLVGRGFGREGMGAGA